MKTPVVIVTGYLGAGKTTLLRRIIDQADRKIAIIMNEFGQIGIDGEVIKGKNMDMIELSGGCVCCSLTGEFEHAVREIIEKVHPEMIIVETTGVAEPDAIALDINENIEGVRLDLVITIVDADSTVRFPSIGHTGRMQIEMADVLLLNKTDLVSDIQVEEIRQKMKEISDRAEIFNVVRCEADIESLLGMKKKRREITKNHGDHIESEGIEHFVHRQEKPFSSERFNEFISHVPKNVYRAKGFVNIEGTDYIFNFVFGRSELEKTKGKESVLVFIGKKITGQKENIIRKLNECEIK